MIRIKARELPRKKSPIFRTTTKNEDQIMDQNNGPEANFSKEETRTLLTTDLREVLLLLTRTSLQDISFANWNNNPKNGRSYDQRRNQYLNRSNKSQSRSVSFNNPNGNWQNNGGFSRFPSTQRRIFRKIIHTVNHEVILLTSLPFAGPTIDLWLVLRLTHKNFHKTIIRLHLM